MQESTANVEEWKKQLQTYKEENSRMKNRILELEGGRGKCLAIFFTSCKSRFPILRNFIEMPKNL